MSADNNNEEITDFDTLLKNFINSKPDDFDELPDTSVQNAAANSTELEPAAEASAAPQPAEKQPAEEPAKVQDVSALSAEGQKENEAASDEFEKELSAAFSEARTTIDEEQNKPMLGADESELAQAYVNFQASVQKLSKEHLHKDFKNLFDINDLYPNYKPSLGNFISADLVSGWTVLEKIFPDTVGKFSVSSTDEEFLNFAETLEDQDLQLAVISYVEIMIDMENCELSYETKLAKYREKHIRRIMYEEYLARKERQRKFTEAVKKKNFPIDADRLISNYFRVAQKDVDGAYKALTTNPAIFAPIDFSKIKPRFFGLVKVTPKDGIRVNIEIGNFLKKLKV